MVKPATARRRNKVMQAQQAQQEAVQQQAARQREDEQTLHDEADVMSFRTAATHRFLVNQELIESVVERWVHVDDIVPPEPFARVQTTKTDIKEINDDDLYFGNLELMKQKLELLENEVKDLEANQGVSEDDNDRLGFGQLRFLSDKINELARSFTDISKPVELEQIKQQYSERMKKTFKEEPYKVRSIPKINNDWSRAPENYWSQIQQAKEEAEKLAQQKRQQQELFLQQQQEQRQQYHQQIPSQHIPPQIPNMPNQPILTQPIPQMQTAEYNDTFIPNAAVVDNPGELNYDPNAFGEDLNMIDDVGFGLQTGLDDQDYLSQMSDGMI